MCLSSVKKILKFPDGLIPQTLSMSRPTGTIRSSIDLVVNVAKADITVFTISTFLLSRCCFGYQVWVHKLHQEKPDLLICRNMLISAMISRGPAYFDLLSENNFEISNNK